MRDKYSLWRVPYIVILLQRKFAKFDSYIYRNKLYAGENAQYIYSTACIEKCNTTQNFYMIV